MEFRFQGALTPSFLTDESLSTCSLMFTQSRLATNKGHGLLQAPRLELSGPGYDLLPFELEAAQPSRIRVQSGESDMHFRNKTQKRYVVTEASVPRSSPG